MTRSTAIFELTTTSGAGPDGFGLNTWLVDELYEQYREDPESLSLRWREFFADYRPQETRRRSRAVQGEARSSATMSATPSSGEDTRSVRHERGAGTVTSEADTEPKTIAADGRAMPEPASEESADQTPQAERLRGLAATIARNMESSREVPTATSVRDVPAKLLEVNRTIINNYFQRTNGGPKVSFTHLIAYAALRALDDVPALRSVYHEVDGEPSVIRHQTVNLGVAMDVHRNGQRGLLVPNIKMADTLSFKEFHQGYENLVRR
ncbi:MAG: 2-oxo acid dehydrogenase subunit E2, partial [Actinomycetota bacterium]|nr:2-oxo acid dehydrogenase subunit E2 [Actinomycetota bacterium]